MNNAENWDKEIEELKTFLQNRDLPTKIELNNFITAINPKLFVDTHLSMIEENNGKKTFLPYLERLKQLKDKLTL
jgi:hypothetical protein